MKLSSFVLLGSMLICLLSNVGCSSNSKTSASPNPSLSDKKSSLDIAEQIPIFDEMKKGEYSLRMEREYFFFVRDDGMKPRLITVADVFHEDKESLSFAVTVNLPYKERDNGLPVNGELDRVCRIEDKIMEHVESKGGLYLGHMTHNGAMKAFFYSPVQLETDFKLKTGPFKSTTISLEVRPDPDWQVYLLEIAPTTIEKEQSMYRQLMKTLKDNGDDHSKSRTVDFAALFPIEQGREDFVKKAETLGFEKSSTVKPLWTDDEGMFWCELVKVSTLESNEIFECTSQLRKLANQHGGEFDGWACTVEK